MKSFILLMLTLVCTQATAQQNPCRLMRRLINDAANRQHKGEFPRALNKLYSARIAARNCSDDSVRYVDDQINKVYLIINQQRIDALKSRDSVKNALEDAKRARDNARMAQKKAVSAQETANRERINAVNAALKADSSAKAANYAAHKADSSARITEASRLTTLALQVKETDPTLALQLIRKACDTSYFNYHYASEILHAILSTTPSASYYLKKIEKGEGDFSSVAITNNGQHLVIGSYAGSIDVWNIAKTSGLDVNKPAANIEGRNGAVLSLAISADGELIISGSIDGSIYRMDSTLKSSPISLTSPTDTNAVLSVAISADKRYLVSSREDKVVIIWNLTNNTLEKKLPLRYGDAIQVCFSPDGRYAGIAGNDETVRVWDWQGTNAPIILEGHLGAVRSVAFSQDGNYIVSGGDDKTVKVWDWKKSETIHTLQGHQGSIMSVAFSPDRSYVVSASQDNTVKVWDLRTNKVYRELRGHQKPVFTAGFYENGRYIYSGSYDHTVKLWDWKRDYMVNPPVKPKNQQKAQSNKRNLNLPKEGLSQSDTTLFSQYVVTQGSDKTIWLWDSTYAPKPAYIICNEDNTSLPVLSGNAIVNSKELYRAFYQKLIKLNGKLIPAMTSEDRIRFFSNAQ
jgi:WD40 repeat protein